ncbi:hypothetical protein QBC39DRAFT_347835 [Podospora conica]|nr:hypothetical protein QBC39DRAFT_347835 [Schizothecium conicum]
MSDSVADYEKALPALFNKPPPADPKDATQEQKVPAASSNKGGFIDLIEYQRQTPDGGIETQIIPSSRYIPQGFNSKSKTKKSYDGHAVVLRRTVVQDGDARPRLLRADLEIQSPGLCAALSTLVGSSFENSDLQAVPIKLPSPFRELFFFRLEIEALAQDETKDDELRSEVQLLVNFTAKNGLLTSIIQDHVRYSKKSQVPADILWTLYPPNSLAVFNGDLVKECWLVRNVQQIVDEQGIYWWQVSGLRLGCNGSAPGLVRQAVIVSRVSINLLTISDLKLVPTEHFRDWKKLHAALVSRADKIVGLLGDTLCGFHAQTYAGTAWDEISPSRTYDESVGGGKVKQVNERVMVDVKAFIDHGENTTIRLEDLRKNDKDQTSQTTAPGRGMVNESRTRCSDPTCKQEGCKVPHDREPKGVHEILEARPFEQEVELVHAAATKEEEIPTNSIKTLAKTAHAVLGVPEKNLMLLFPGLLPAFGLKSKKWRWVLADKLEDVVWSKAAFEFLQLNQGTKRLVQCLVEGHKDSVTMGFDDVVAGKGQGLIFLLHGEPGLGKTLTAEGIADFLKRPLYSISGGELTTDVDRAEKRLDEVFDLTSRWDAVALLDEADVLLCKRNSSEMERNAIVGVFLRKLEYFQGVLFLTTNQKQDFDEAFKSRIHVTITYPALNATARASIWRDLIEKNKNAGVKVDASWLEGEEVFDALGDLDLNGRTIKNIIRTAVAYAYGEGKPLGTRHVLDIVQTELADISDGPPHASPDNEEEKRAQGALRRLQKVVEA